jgi:2-amino-4-hydroxy-6-hydroxymethyldihydropteridine diphosphokinase
MSHRVYIALGSNLGNRQANLRAALVALPPAVRPLAASKIYETDPWGYADQPAFLNQVVQADTRLSPSDLLVYIKRLETGLGRQPTFQYGPRLIDLDILFYDDLVLETPQLSLPHPRLAERAFVLVPLADLAPALRHPVSGLTITDLLAKVDANGVRLFSVKE